MSSTVGKAGCGTAPMVRRIDGRDARAPADCARRHAAAPPTGGSRSGARSCARTRTRCANSSASSSRRPGCRSARTTSCCSWPRRPERRLRMAELADRVLLSRSGSHPAHRPAAGRRPRPARAVARRRARHVHRADDRGPGPAADGGAGAPRRHPGALARALHRRRAARAGAAARPRGSAPRSEARRPDGGGSRLARRGAGRRRVRLRVRGRRGGGRVVGAAVAACCRCSPSPAAPSSRWSASSPAAAASPRPWPAGCCWARATPCTRCGCRRCCRCAGCGGCSPRSARSTSPPRWRSAQPTPELARVAFWWTFAGVFTFWNLSTLLGSAGRLGGRPVGLRAGRRRAGRLPRAARARACATACWRSGSRSPER